jgi:SAM-dependent methyltransferase
VQTGNEQKIGPHGIASVTLTARWTDGRAQHEDHLHVEKFSVFRQQDCFPAEFAGRISDMQQGDTISARFVAGEITGSWDTSLSLETSPSVFDRHFLRGLQIDPRAGRFYPGGFFHNIGDVVRQQTVAVRITTLTADSMSIDLNLPLSRYDLSIELHVEQIHNGSDLQTERTSNCLDELLLSPGFKARLASGEYVDYGGVDNGMARLDLRPDNLFYQDARFTQHLDTIALQSVNDLYRRLIDDDTDVLDLMASHDSHLQGISLRSLQVLGMNKDELSDNKMASTFTVHDLNQTPQLPYSDESLDAVVCTASVEYLTDPLAVFAEVKRVLRPGGVFINSFSNRWFPTKAIRIWKELHEFERVGMVTQWMEKSGFTGLCTFSSRGQPRPADDPYINVTKLSDPVHAVWGTKEDY